MVKFLTYCTDFNKAQRLIDSATRCGVDLKIITEPQSVFTDDFKSKSVAVRLFMLQQPLYDVWCVVDAYDVLVVGQPKIPQHIEDFVIFNAETNCYPDSSLASFYPPSPTRYQYLNAGAYMGTTKNIVAMLEAAIPQMNKRNIDQLVFSKKFVHEKNSGIMLDTGCEIFQTLYQVPRVLFSYEDGKFTNLETNTTPCVIHGNGQSDMSWIAL